MKESDIQNMIRVGTADRATLFRTNAGTFWQGKRVYSKEFGQDVLINLRRVEGLPDGYSDLSGVRHSDGKAVFVEVKTANGTVRPAQSNFIRRMRELGAVAGVCRSVEDALDLIGGMGESSAFDRNDRAKRGSAESKPPCAASTISDKEGEHDAG